ncbi:MAG: DUF349 domain-containing protein [Pseudomonadota bacterium]
MFEFLFKKPGDDVSGAQPDAAAPPEASLRALQADYVKGLDGNEAGAVDFILRSEYSELRLAAAEHVHTRAQLEVVHAAMRNTDRRVAKLVQGRLDAIRHQQSEHARGEACIEQARHWLADDRLTPNHVADVDRAWAVVQAPELVETFNAVRLALAQRLEAQVNLQRGVINRLAALRQLAPDASLAQQLETLGNEHAADLAAPEHPSLPRQLLSEFGAEYARLVAIAATPQTLAPAPAAVEAPKPERKAREKAPAGQPADQAFLDKVDALEAALAQGALHVANDLDKALKDTRGIKLTAVQTERLAQLRAELKRLSDWARWSGNVSREELIKAVEQLGEQKLAMSELAKKVGSLRASWKALDTVSGAAPKGLWERFDTACTTAYAPAAAHFKHLSEERHTNAAKAEALIAEASAEAARLAEAGQADWKHMASASQRLRQAWQHLGAIDRKHKKRLDGEFAAALKTIDAPLSAQRKVEVAGREALIAEVAALNAQDRHSLDALRSVQERWQERARALPLERKSEQALWQRFRAACDEVFARRKESAHAADAERRAHQVAKEAICARLEGVETGDAKVLRDAATEWQSIGAVPRANEGKLDKRYHAAVARIQAMLDTVRRNASVAQASALRDKLRLCHELEAAIATHKGDGVDWEARWAALPALQNDYERTLGVRFAAARRALADGRDAYIALMEKNQPKLLQDILRLEIVAGVDSGSEFARDRLKLQVEVLQSSLKSGQKPVTQAAQFLQLCATPALADARTLARIEHLFPRVGKEHK